MCGEGSGELEPKGPAVSVWGSGVLTPLAQGRVCSHRVSSRSTGCVFSPRL